MSPTFDFVVLGCGGGPNEYNLSSYLVKSCDTAWSEGIIAIEAGSGLGALQRALRENPSLFPGTYDPNDPHLSKAAASIYSQIQCYLITHAHLDHVNGLVLTAGSVEQRRKVFGLEPTLQDLETIFSDRLWPNLASWDDHDPDIKLLYSKLNADGQYQAISDHISVRTMTVSHGKGKAGSPYDSATFFIRHDASSREFLFFGDVEPDSVASNPRNKDVWRTAAHKVPDTLSAIFIECSWPSGRPDEMLYGHLSPEHVRDELVTLASEVSRARQNKTANPSSSHSSTGEPSQKRKKINPPSPGSLAGVLDGIRVYIIHCKEDLEGIYNEPIHQVIAGQVQKLVNELKLGVKITAVEQGMHILI